MIEKSLHPDFRLRCVFLMAMLIPYTASLASQSTTTQYEYDAIGNLVNITDPSGNVTRYGYDALSRRIQITDPASGNIRLSYNGQNRLTSVTDPRSLATTYQLDGLSNQINLISPDTGTTHRTFDTSGNILTSTDAKGQTTSYVYDVLNRITRINFADGQYTAYMYDEGNNGVGRLSTITDSSGSINYSYDQHGRVLQESRNIQGVIYNTAYTYDNAGQLSSMTYPSGRQLLYTRDALGRINQIASMNNGKIAIVADRISYAPTGQLLSYLNETGNIVRYTTDLDGRITSYSLNQQVRSLDYDDSSRIINQTDPTVTVQYSYDGLNRLKSAISDNSTYRYEYDGTGNRTSMVSGNTMPQYSYSSQSNQLTQINDGTQVRVIQSDANGSITDNATNRFGYDARGRLVSAQTFSGTATYKINALGQRISKTTPSITTVFHYDHYGYLIGENAGSAGTDYIYLNGIPVAVGFSNSDSLFYIYSDQLATPRLIADNAGTTVWQWDGEPFGNSPPNENPSGAGIFKFNLRFPGQYYDAETNLNQNYFRDYDPTTGRYIESDLIGLNGGISTFGYSRENPLRYTDSLGLDVTITINRDTYTAQSITGTINVSSDVTSQSFSGYTLENAAPPNPNLPVPPGTYAASLRPDHTPQRIEINNVLNAHNVQIHNGNTASDVIGCFAVGTTRSANFVGNSVATMNSINSIITADGTGNITVLVNGGKTRP